jgi:hypothetical protein
MKILRALELGVVGLNPTEGAGALKLTRSRSALLKRVPVRVQRRNFRSPRDREALVRLSFCIVLILHIASDPARTVTAVDARLIVAAIVAGIAAQVLIWQPLPFRTMVQNVKRVHRAQVVAAFVLLFVVLPNAFPWDHVFLDADEHASSAEHEVHAAHCHESPGTCSDLPLLSGPGQFLFADPVLPPPPPMTSRSVVLLEIAVTANAVVPDTPPPRA